MTSREFLSVALLLVSIYDEGLMQRADGEARAARNLVERQAWEVWRDEDALRLGVCRALWLEARPC